jgi:ArsR family transcriptional regulator
VAPEAIDLELYRMQAEIAKALGNPLRLRILDLVGDREVAYGALLDDLGVSKPNLSQHLARLRQAGVVSVRREGAHVYYRLTFPEIKAACTAMRGALARHLNENGRQGRRLGRQAMRAGRSTRGMTHE